MSISRQISGFCFCSDKKQTKQTVLKRLEDAIKLHRDDKGQAVINPALLALFRASSNKLRYKIQKIREQRDIVTGKQVVRPCFHVNFKYRKADFTSPTFFVSLWSLNKIDSAKA